MNFVQIGAFDGTTGDPLYHYIRNHGWQGLLVEPQADACKIVQKLHADNPKITIVNAAVGKERGSATLYTVKGEDLPSWCGALASFSKESILKHNHLIPGLENCVVAEEVATVTFADILSSAGKEDQLDVLQIDTEGADAEILRLFPFNSSRPAIVHWEIKHLTKEEKEDCLERLSSYGYRFASSGGEDMLAVLPC